MLMQLPLDKTVNVKIKGYPLIKSYKYLRITIFDTFGSVIEIT